MLYARCFLLITCLLLKVCRWKATACQAYSGAYLTCVSRETVTRFETSDNVERQENCS